MERDVALERVFEPVRPPTTFEETVERLGTAIRLGLLAPGSRLPSERSLAGQLENLALDASAGSDDADTERPPGFLARAHGRHVRGRAAAAGGARRESRWARKPGRCSITAWRSRSEPRSWQPNGPSAEQLDRLDLLVKKMAGAHDFEYYRRVDIRFHIGVAEAARSPRLVRAMTEVQGQMSDLIAMIAHPEQVLTHSNEQHRQLVALLRRGDGTRAMQPDARAHRGTEHILAGLI